ncbi:MAG: ATP-binding protein [Devosiaceae bacterium]|nr:ATP-binding protein [Devosiaceae bacterium]
MSKSDTLKAISQSIKRLAAAVEKIGVNNASSNVKLGDANAYIWSASESESELIPVQSVSRVPLELLCGIEDQARTLEQNTLQFARGHGANNALLWGSRGMGKSSLVKALHGDIVQRNDADLKRLVLVEINREDIITLPALMRVVAKLPAQFVIYCDDLSFDAGESSYKSLKTILDGGLEGRPQNTLFYATSNRRHLMPREMIDNERSSAINPGEAVHEKISLSDRFGLWLGFHNCSQEQFLEMIARYVEFYGLDISDKELKSRAIEWAATRGARSGRVAIQLVRQIAGEMGKNV